MQELRTPQHNREPSHQLVPLLLGVGLQPELSMATRAGHSTSPHSCLCLAGVTWVGHSQVQMLVLAPCGQTTPLTLFLVIPERPWWLWAVHHQGCGHGLHLHSAEPAHVHLEQPVPPGRARDAGVVDAARDVAERGTVLEEAVVLVIQLEGACRRGGLQEKGRAGGLQNLPEPSRPVLCFPGQALTALVLGGALSQSGCQTVLGEQEGGAEPPR